MTPPPGRAAPAGLPRPPVVPRGLGPRPARTGAASGWTGSPSPRRPVSGSGRGSCPADDAVAFVQAGHPPDAPAPRRTRAGSHAGRRRVAAQVGRWGTSARTATGCVLEMNVDDLGWPVMVLAGSARTSSSSRRPSWRRGSPRSAPASPAPASRGSPVGNGCPGCSRAATSHWTTPRRAQAASTGSDSSWVAHSEGRGTDRIDRLEVSRTASSALATTRAVIAVVPPWCSSR